MNRESFSNQFIKKCGVNFNVFLNTVKMEYAKILMATTNMKNYEIADILGYSTLDYFTRIFKECNGITPTQFRKRLI